MTETLASEGLNFKKAKAVFYMKCSFTLNFTLNHKFLHINGKAYIHVSLTAHINMWLAKTNTLIPRMKPSAQNGAKKSYVQ